MKRADGTALVIAVFCALCACSEASPVPPVTPAAGHATPATTAVTRTTKAVSPNAPSVAETTCPSVARGSPAAPDNYGLPSLGAALSLPGVSEHIPGLGEQKTLELAPNGASLRVVLGTVASSYSGVVVLRRAGAKWCVVGSRVFDHGRRVDIEAAGTWVSARDAFAVVLLKVTDWYGAIPPATGMPSDESWLALGTDGNGVWNLTEQLTYGSAVNECTSGLCGLGDVRLREAGTSVELVASGHDGRSRTFVSTDDHSAFIPAGTGPSVTLVAASRASDGEPPAWSFAVRGYPAIHRKTGRLALAVTEDDGLATLPNLRIEVRAKNGKRVDSIAVLAQNEFRTISSESDTRMREVRLSGLAATVRERLRPLSGLIDPDEWTPLSLCEGPAPEFNEAAFGDLPQLGSCGKTTYRYSRTRVAWQHGAVRRTRHLPGARGRSFVNADGAKCEMRDALVRVYTDAASSLLLLGVGYALPGGGDGYGQTETWHVLGE